MTSFIHYDIRSTWILSLAELETGVGFSSNNISVLFVILFFWYFMFYCVAATIIVIVIAVKF
jgi:hypothetical protein